MILPRKLNIFKRLRQELALPNPLDSSDDLEEVTSPGGSLAGSDYTALQRARTCCKLQLLFYDQKHIIFVDSKGAPVTAGGYLIRKLARIEKMIEEAGP